MKKTKNKLRDADNRLVVTRVEEGGGRGVGRGLGCSCRWKLEGGWQLDSSQQRLRDAHF